MPSIDILLKARNILSRVPTDPFRYWMTRTPRSGSRTETKTLNPRADKLTCFQHGVRLRLGSRLHARSPFLRQSTDGDRAPAHHCKNFPHWALGVSATVRLALTRQDLWRTSNAGAKSATPSASNLGTLGLERSSEKWMAASGLINSRNFRTQDLKMSRSSRIVSITSSPFQNASMHGGCHD